MFESDKPAPRAKAAGVESGEPAAPIRGFPPIAGSRSAQLILGSMPGARSLEAGEYYAHPQNAFWRILGEILGFPRDAPYLERIQRLERAGVAIWDVLACCRRTSSLDSDIARESMRPNDFRAFFGVHSDIRQILFNGATAQDVFERRVVPALPEAARAIPRRRLPSTSAAHASMSAPAKLEVWRAAMVPLLRGGGR